MSFFSWNEKYSVGIESIDNDHRKLVEIIDQLYQALCRGEASWEVSSTVQKLIEYTNYHFSREEEIMLSVGYSGYNDHIKIHKSFIDKVNNFNDELKSGSLTISVEVITFLRDWLILHIQHTDRDYLPDFNSSGVK